MRSKVSSETLKPEKHTSVKTDSRQSKGSKKPKSQGSNKGGKSNKPWTPDQYKVPVCEGKVRFHDVDLPQDLMHAVADLGFQYCTPVQARVLMEAKGGVNVTARAQTGTGKTAAFLIQMLTDFLSNPLPEKPKTGTPRALIIAPTRELVIQIAKDAVDLGKYCRFKALAVYGGTEYEKQMKALNNGVLDLVAATPGRLLDFRNKGVLDLSKVEVLVIDEADRMLDMGFIPDVKRIIRCLPAKNRRRTMLFSATLTDAVTSLAAQWMPEPVVRVDIEPESVTVDTVEQKVYAVPSKDKFTLLYNLLKKEDVDQALVFGNRRISTERLVDRLRRHGIDCELLSGSVNQNKRMRVLDDFKQGKVKIVVATDVAGRGIHVDGISHVINYDFPYEAENYVHRIGRTGRAGVKGVAISFACEEESFVIPEIEEYIGTELRCMQPEEELLKQPPRPQRSSGSSSSSRSSSSSHGSRGGHGSRDSKGPRRSSGSGNSRNSRNSRSSKPR